MSVSYTSNIYTQDRLFFIKLLFRWTGSVWQLLWVDFIFFIAIYITLAVVYQNIIYNDIAMRRTFEVTVKWIGLIRTSVPLSFMLGFFVTSVLSRWWSTCMCIPWLHSPSFYCQAVLDTSKLNKSDISRKIRITILRYLNLSWILMMASISSHVKERFGYWRLEKKKFKLTWQNRLDMINKDNKVRKYFGSLITDNEMQAFARAAELSNDTELTYSPEYWLPLVWATRLLRRARNIGCIADERQHLYLVEVVASFRSALGTVWTYSEFNIPLVYTQVAVAAVYIFLAATLVSTQLTESEFGAFARGLSSSSSSVSASSTGSGVNATQLPNGVQILAYIPIVGSLEFIFYLGWFKIGVCLLNCLGKDKADLPLSDILDSNLKASVKIGGAEDTIFPTGLADNGDPEEQQIADFLRFFDFNAVHAHDKFVSPEDTEQQLNRALLKRLRLKQLMKLDRPGEADAMQAGHSFSLDAILDKKAVRRQRQAAAEQQRKRQLQQLIGPLTLADSLLKVESNHSLQSAESVSDQDQVYRQPALRRSNSMLESVKFSDGVISNGLGSSRVQDDTRL